MSQVKHQSLKKVYQNVALGFMIAFVFTINHKQYIYPNKFFTEESTERNEVI